jgi:hypothetical protein
VPGMFYGAVVWWSHHGQKLSRRTRSLWAACLCLSLLFTFTLNPSRTWSFIIPDSVDPWVHLTLTKQWGHANEVRSLLTQIPPEASVTATDNLLPHISGRRAILRFPTLQFQDEAGATTDVDYVLVDFWQLQQYAGAFSGSRDRLLNGLPVVQALVDGGYGIVAETPGVFLLERDAPSLPTALSEWQRFQAATLAEFADS